VTNNTEQNTNRTVQNPLPHLDQKPIIGYIQSVSPIKLSPKKYSYLNFKFQTEQHIIESVCFQPTLHKQFNDKCETQKSLKLSNYYLKRSFVNEDSKSIVVNKRCKLEDTQCNFDFLKHNEQDTALSKIPYISPEDKQQVFNLFLRGKKMYLSQKTVILRNRLQI
jgi:hypothetical protein